MVPVLRIRKDYDLNSFPQKKQVWLRNHTSGKSRELNVIHTGRILIAIFRITSHNISNLNQMLMKKLLLAACAISVFWACSTPESKPATSPEPVATKKPPVEYGDTTLVELCKKSMMAMAAGDIDGFTANIGDSAIYHFNNFDSLVGKPAITNFWKDRRKNVIDKMAFTEDIWLPIKNNADGTNWVFYWTTVDATYKTGKSMKQRMHFDYHFAKSGKIDLIYHYRDQLAIDKASKK